MIYRIDCSFNFFEIASARFVCKFTYTHILAIFNLVQLSYILSIALLYVLSVRQKVPKSRAVVYGIRCFLCSRVALQHLSVGSHLAARCLSQCLGRQELAALKHHATYFQALLGCSLCLPTLPFRPWRGITFCNEISWHATRTFARKKVISKKPAVSKSQRKSLLFGGHCARYVQTQYGNYLFLKLPYAV